MYAHDKGYRDAMAAQIYIAASFLITPFVVLAIVRGNWLLAIPTLFTNVLCALNVASYYLQKRFWFPPLLISGLYVVDFTVVIATMGELGVYWCYPTMLAMYWVHSPRVARQVVSVFYVTVVVTCFYYLPLDTSARVAVTLVMTLIFFNIAASILEEQYEKLQNLTITDHLTNCFNRRFMDGKIDELIERKRRNGDTASLITLDVDHFKKINDRYGHSVGDKVLIEIVRLVRSRVRQLDSLCRSGGEEFVVLLPNTGEADARNLAEELRQSIMQSPLLKDSTVTISCGVSEVRVDDFRDTWLHRSDKALYSAKRNGRNKVVVSNPAFMMEGGCASNV